MNNLRLKSYVLTDGENDYPFSAELDMSDAMADKVLELINAWKNRAGS